MAAARDQAARIVRETANDEVGPEAGAQLADPSRNQITDETRRRPADAPSGPASEKPAPASAGATTAGGSAGATTLPDDVTCYRIVSRSSAAGAKFSVPTTPDLYQCFDYDPPWGNKEVQIVSATAIIDNDQVLHHWILYNQSSAVTDGSTSACSGAHPNAAMVVGWAPGGDPMHLPDDVGLQVETGGFTLEVHYNNKLGAGQLDASGVDLCVTDKLRPKVAAVHWLGSQNLNKVEASGTCTPVNSGPVTILTSTPYMHLQGWHLKTVINRKAGGTEVLID